MEEYTADMAEALSSVEIATPKEVFAKVLSQHRIDVAADELLDKILVKGGPTGVGIYSVEQLDALHNTVGLGTTWAESEERRKLVDREEYALMSQKVVAESYLEKGARIVRARIDKNLDKSDPPVEYEVFPVWFCKALQNWKALYSTTLNDQMYYEVTYNCDKRETYVDSYKKWSNDCVPDED